jgi:hypothetical protein
MNRYKRHFQTAIDSQTYGIRLGDFITDPDSIEMTLRFVGLAPCLKRLDILPMVRHDLEILIVERSAVCVPLTG